MQAIIRRGSGLPNGNESRITAASVPPANVARQPEFGGHRLHRRRHRDADRIDDTVHHFEVAGGTGGVGNCAGTEQLADRIAHRIEICCSTDEGVGESQEYGRIVAAGVAIAVADRSKVDLHAGCLGARTEHPAVGVQSEEALVDQRRARRHQLQLPPRKTLVDGDLAHLGVAQVEGTVEVGLRFRFGRDDR